jgi:hypothetical protein
MAGSLGAFLTPPVPTSERMVLETDKAERTVVSSVLDSPMYTGIITITSRYL